MTQDNVEQTNKSPKWIVPIPQGEGGTFGRPSLCAACRGNEDIGVVLNYFVFEASCEAKNKKIDLEKAEYIRLKRGLDEILDGIKPSRTSKTTLIGYHHKLHEWGLVISDGYKQQYDVYFHKITEAIQNPPPSEKRKPRGRHVSKSQNSTDSSSEDFSFNNGLKLESSTVKIEIQGDSNFNQIPILTSQISKLEFEISNLKSQISALKFEISNLKSLESSEATPQQGSDTKIEPLRLLRQCNRLLETIKSNMAAVPRNMFTLLTEEDYRTIDELITVTSVASATPSPLIENLYQSHSLSNTYPPEPPQGGVTPTLAGNTTAALGENTQGGTILTEPQETPTDHTAILEPHVNATDDPPQERAVISGPKTNTPESAPQSQPVALSTQAVNDLPNQAAKQAEQQASGTIEIPEPNLYTEEPFKDRPVEVKRNGRKINPVSERVKWFYDTFTDLGVEFFDLETFKADYFYGKSNPTYQLVITYISEGVSPFDMRLAFEHMWNEEKDGKHFWQNPDTLTTRAFCNNFRAKLLGAKFKKKQEERKEKEQEEAKKSSQPPSHKSSPFAAPDFYEQRRANTLGI